MKPKKKNRPSAGHKGTKKSGITQVIGQIKHVVSKKCRSWHIVLDPSEVSPLNGESQTLYAHTTGKRVVCPCCGKPTSTVHIYRLRKIQCKHSLKYTL